MLSYLEAWDVKAHMIRVFGFAKWSWVVQAKLYEDERDGKDVAYKIVGSLQGRRCVQRGCCGICEASSRGEAQHGYKTAESDAFKRAAINLGDQFDCRSTTTDPPGPLSQQPLTSG